MTSDDSGAQDRRETKAAKHLERARAGGEAKADYAAVKQATDDKTVRLKALRLDKAKTDKAEADKVKVDKAKAAKKR
jgi:hypothetical protein